MSQTENDYEAVWVRPETKRRIRVYKAREGITYTQALESLLEHTDE